MPVVKKLATDSRVNNAYKVRDESANDDRECGVSIDGSWQKRGYSSHNGVVTVISLDTKKCLDVEVLSDKCQQCQKWEKKINDPSYSAWKASHVCKINHEGSAGSMETVGAVRIFHHQINFYPHKFRVKTTFARILLDVDFVKVHMTFPLFFHQKSAKIVRFD